MTKRKRAEKTSEDDSDEDLFEDALEKLTVADEPAPKAVSL